MELTNDQVIEWLRFAQKRINDITYSPETFYSIEKAIDIIQYISDTNVGDLISRKAALDIFDDYNVAVEFNGNIEAYSRDRKRLCELPSVMPKQRTGHWISVGVVEVVGGESAMWGSAIAYHKCSECDGQALRDDFEEEVLSKWCPHCGAMMM